MAIVGDFTGGWPTQNQETQEWDWSMAKLMTQDTNNPAIWTLEIKDFEAEAKKYEYKAAANNSWDGYKLPDEGNADFVFGTDDYPAGKYDLTFTVNTEEHKLAIEVTRALTPDGINAIIVEAQQGNVYNMQGVRVAHPAKGNLYIVNGKKVVIK
jgi:hypothetical protein